MRRPVVKPRRHAALAAIPMLQLAAALGLTLTLAVAPPSSATTLFGLVTTGEIYRSTNDGASWTGIATLPVHDAVALSARLSTSDLFLATRSGSIYRSLDAGLTWSAVGAIPASDVEDLVIRPDGSLLVLTATGSLYQSVDLGATFTPLAALTASNFRSLTFTAPAVTYYAVTSTGEVYESTDGGTSWTPKGAIAVPDARRIRAVLGTLFVISDAGDVYRSTDGGASWTAVGTLSQVGVRGLVRTGGALAAATREGHVATSPTGASWAWQGSINQLELTALASDEPATTSVDGLAGGPVALAPPYPNPSTGEATLAIHLERESEVRLTLHDVSGRLVAERAPERLAAGDHAIRWRPGVRAAGFYFVRLQTGESSESWSRRWVVVR